MLAEPKIINKTKMGFLINFKSNVKVIQHDEESLRRDNNQLLTH